MTVSEPALEEATGEDVGSLALPRTVFVVMTMALERSAASRSLFRPCEFGPAWRTEPRPDQRYEDFDPALAQELRLAGPHFTGEVCSDDLLADPAAAARLTGLAASFGAVPLLLTLRSAHLGLTDVGYGTVTLEFAVAPGPRPGPEIMDLSVVNELRPAAVDLAAPYLTDLSFADGERPTGATCLWGHVLYDFARTAGLDLATLAPDVERDEGALRVQVIGGFVKPGLGSSVVAGTDARAVRITARVLALVSGYYAAAAEFDREIFGRLRARVHQRARDSIYDRLFEEVSLFQAVLSTLDLHLAASTAMEVRVWGQYARAWRLDRQLTALTQKLDLLRTFQDREVARLSLERSQHLSVVAAVFTMLGFVSTLLALVDFGQADALARPNVIRSALSLLLVLLVVAVFAMWVRTRTGPPE